jgi:hypothetical protein
LGGRIFWTASGRCGAGREAATMCLAARSGGNGGRMRLDREENEGKLVVSCRPTHFSTCAGAPARPLWTRHDLDVPDGNYAHAEWKLNLRGPAGQDFSHRGPQIAFGEHLGRGGTSRDALMSPETRRNQRLVRCWSEAYMEKVTALHGEPARGKHSIVFKTAWFVFSLRS